MCRGKQGTKRSVLLDAGYDSAKTHAPRGLRMSRTTLYRRIAEVAPAMDQPPGPMRQP